MAAVAAVLSESPGRNERTLLAALACSLALHLALLYLPPGFFDAQRKAPEPKVMTARLVEPEPQPAAVVEQLEPKPQQVAKTIRATPQKPAPRSEPVAPSVIAVAPPPASAPAAANRAPAPQPAPLPVLAAVAASARPPAADPGSIAQFRLELIELARRYKRYPRAAIDNNWEGKADLRMIVAASGAIASLSVRKSAGYAALDDEAQQMFRAAKGQLAIPPALRGKEFIVDVSADFYFVKE
jgi:TonB family protein